MAVEKNEVVHEVLKALCTGKQYQWMPDELVREMNTLFKRYSIHQINYACDVLHKDTKLIYQLSTDQWVMLGNGAITRFRELYEGGAYKEKQKWYVWPSRIGATLVGAAGIWGVIDGSQSKILQHKLDESIEKIELMKQQAEKDSIKIQEKNERILQLIEDNYETPIMNKSDSSNLHISN